MRAGRVLNRISAEDGARAGISDYERPRYIRIDRAKGNNSPASETRWVTFANVTLPRGDDVGVMTLWVPPHLDKAQVTETHHRAAGVFLAILRRFNAAGRRVSDSKNAGNYAPRQFAQEREAREAAVSKALLQHVMNDMLSDGTIRTSGGRRGSHQALAGDRMTGGDGVWTVWDGVWMVCVPLKGEGTIPARCRQGGVPLPSVRGTTRRRGKFWKSAFVAGGSS